MHNNKILIDLSRANCAASTANDSRNSTVMTCSTPIHWANRNRMGRRRHPIHSVFSVSPTDDLSGRLIKGKHKQGMFSL